MEITQTTPQPEDGPRSTAVTDDVRLDEGILAVVDEVLRIQAPLADRFVDRMRRRRPGEDTDALTRRLERQFVTSMTGSGAGVGGVAALPGVGTAVAIGLTTGEGIAFVEACAFLTLSIARAHGVDMHDQAVRRTVVLSVLGGEQGELLVSKATGRRGVRWTGVVGGMVPEAILNPVDRRLRRWVRTRLAARAGGVWTARLIPFGIGAAIGAVSNLTIARAVLVAERTAFAASGTVVTSLITEDRPTPTGGDEPGAGPDPSV
jgi:hypothetical protein